MSLLRRAERLESLAVSETIRREGTAFRQWLHELSREEALVFLDFCLPTLVANNAAPIYRVLPSEMTRDERSAYREALLRWSAERKERGEVGHMAEHRMAMDVWRRFVQRPFGTR
jgi:hypothetical protein